MLRCCDSMLYGGSTYFVNISLFGDLKWSQITPHWDGLLAQRTTDACIGGTCTCRSTLSMRRTVLGAWIWVRMEFREHQYGGVFSRATLRQSHPTASCPNSMWRPTVWSTKAAGTSGYSLMYFHNSLPTPPQVSNRFCFFGRDPRLQSDHLQKAVHKFFNTSEWHNTIGVCLLRCARLATAK